MPNKAHKILLLFVGLLWAAHAEAQFNKGAILLDANANYFTNFKDKNAPEGTKSSYQFGIGASAGYMLSAQDELGVGMSYSSNQNYFLSTSLNGIPIFFSNVRRAWSVSPSVFWRHYSALGERLSFVSGVSFSGDFGNTEYQDVNTSVVYERDFTAFDLGYTPSLAYLLTPKLGIRGNFGLVGFSFAKEEGQDNWNRSFRMSFSPQNLNFGIFLLLNGTE